MMQLGLPGEVPFCDPVAPDLPLPFQLLPLMLMLLDDAAVDDDYAADDNDAATVP
jgi:hypothetical protein